MTARVRHCERRNDLSTVKTSEDLSACWDGIELCPMSRRSVGRVVSNLWPTAEVNYFASFAFVRKTEKRVQGDAALYVSKGVAATAWHSNNFDTLIEDSENRPDVGTAHCLILASESSPGTGPAVSDL